MTGIAPIIFIGLCGGLAIGLQGPFSSFIGQRLGIWEAVFIIHLGGAVAALVPLLFMEGGKLGQWHSLPWYMLCGGIFGLVVVGAISYLIPLIGAATAMVLIVAGQLLTGAVLDHFGAFGLEAKPLELSRILGLILVFGGVWITVRA